MNNEELLSILNFYAGREHGGSGLDFYSNPFYNQRGSGVGSFLSGVFSSILPIVRKSTKFLTPYLLKLVREIAGDFAENSSSLPNSLKNHGLNTLENITSDAIKKMKGGRVGMIKKQNISTTMIPSSSSMRRIKAVRSAQPPRRRRRVKGKSKIKRKVTHRKKSLLNKTSRGGVRKRKLVAKLNSRRKKTQKSKKAKSIIYPLF